MTDNANGFGGQLRAWLRGAAWVAGSFAAFFLLFFDPLDLHPADSWLQRTVGYNAGPMTAAAPGGEAASAAGEREIVFYRNPMDPTITSPVPAKDEMGMDYVPVYADEAERALGAGTTVAIDPVVVQNMNVQTQIVEKGDLRHEIRTVGYLEYDQERMVTVTTKYDGWVEKVYVNHVGEPVAEGAGLFEVYSPELVQTEQELLSAMRYAARFRDAPDDARLRAEALVDAARARLAFWDISPAQIARLEETGEIFRTLTVTAPAGGLVMKRMPGLEGMAVTPGMEAYHIADITSLWLSVEVFEDQVVWIRPGAEAEVTFTYFPGETIRGTVEFIEPELSEQTRTLTVKIAVPNPDGRLRKGMFATVVFDPVLVRGAVTAPTESVLRTGRRSVVIVALGDGRFEPREVELGHAHGGLVEVRSGLAAGDRIVTSSQFLLDSESKLRAAVQTMLSGAAAPAETHVGHDMGDMDHEMQHEMGHEGHDMSHAGHEMDHEGHGGHEMSHEGHEMDHEGHTPGEPEKAADPHHGHEDHGHENHGHENQGR